VQRGNFSILGIQIWASFTDTRSLAKVSDFSLIVREGRRHGRSE